ncbi:MAG: hypothetical protein P4L58_01275, partial [Candidatus Pacebacteria bacterium]|nr:hypothetical protein [Candidatus Paceibacterota bacterium]
MKQKLKYLLAVFLLAGSFFLKAAIVRAQEDDSGGYSDYSDYSDTSGLNFDSNDSASVGSYDSSYNYLNDPASYYGVDTSNNDQNNNASSSGYQDYVNNPNNVYLNDPNNPPISDTPKFPSGYTADNDPSMPLNDAGTGYLDSQGSEYNQELNSQAPTQVPGIENRLNVVSPGELEKNSPNNLYDSSQGYTMDEGSGAVVATPDPSTVNDGKGTDLPAFSSNDTITSSEGKQAQDLYNQSVDSWNNDLSASDAKINGLT